MPAVEWERSTAPDVMAEFDIKTTYESGLDHHLLQGREWLRASDEGERTAAVSYAALEFRFAIERLALHYWRILIDREPTHEELEKLRSFKAVEKKIYELAGHQREIDRHFEFMQIVTDAIQLPLRLQAPSISTLSRHWHLCSELCHIDWPLACSVKELRSEVFSTLGKVEENLVLSVNSLAWPNIKDENFKTIRADYIAERIGADHVRGHLHRIGVWACYKPPGDGEPQFVGVPIPEASEPSNIQ